MDITHMDINKNLLYAQMGIPELWRFDGQVLEFFWLEQGQYQAGHLSPSFPWISKEVIYRFLRQCQVVGETPAYLEFRQWVQSTDQKRLPVNDDSDMKKC
jgi:hypothetical protein